MSSIPRHLFLKKSRRKNFLTDEPLPIGSGFNSTKPGMVGYMLSLLSNSGTVLEIGTGSGWQTAILSKIYSEVFSIECSKYLFEQAKKNLRGYDVNLKHGDGLKGWNEKQFDNVIVCFAVKDYKGLKSMITDNGVLIVPVLENAQQFIHRITKDSDERLIECKFVKQ